MCFIWTFLPRSRWPAQRRHCNHLRLSDYLSVCLCVCLWTRVVHWLGQSAGWVGLDRNLQPFRGLDSVVSLDLLVAKIKFSVVYLLSGVAQYSLAYSATTIVGPSFFCDGLGQSGDGLRWAGSKKMDRRTTLLWAGLREAFTSNFHETLQSHGRLPWKEPVKVYVRSNSKWPNGSHSWLSAII